MEQQSGEKILFIMRCLPYELGGTPIGMRNLLKNFDPEQLIVLGRTVDPKKKLEKDSIKYKMYEIPTPQVKGMRLWRFLSVIPGFFIGIYIIRKYRIKKIVGLYPDEGSLLLSYLLSITTRARYFPYFFDLYKEFTRHNWQDNVAKWLQKRVFKRADKVIALTGGMTEYYKNTYNLVTTTLPNVINTKINKKEFSTDYFFGNRKFKIAYSGSINEDRLDTMQEFAKCVIGNPQFEIYYFTSQSVEYLNKVGLIGSNTYVKFCKNADELMSELGNMDLLYLPLSFNVAAEKLPNMMTCFGTKTYEYLVCGKPILVHSPTEYYNYKFLAQNNCAFTLGANFENEISDFMDNLLKNYASDSSVIVSNAFDTAIQFEAKTIKNTFLNTILIN